jgi:hypothetical protein
MAARQFRWLLFGELLAYAVLGHWLTSRAGWTPPQAAGLAVAAFLGVRLFVVGLTFALMRQGAARFRQSCVSAVSGPCAWCSRSTRQ